jgi:hypothetical protein
MIDLLARDCAACGRLIGGGYKHRPKCNIYLCWYCRYVLQTTKKEFSAKCPMCSGEFE